MPLKKPSDLFGDESREENDIPVVEVSEENFDSVFNVFKTYKEYLNDFETKLESVNYLSEQISSLKEEINQVIHKEDLDKAIFSQFLYVNESINSIENNVKAINEEKLKEIREDSKYLLKKVTSFVEEDLPKHKKKITEFELKYDEQVKMEKVESMISDLDESYSGRVEYIENYLRKAALGSYKKALFDKVARIRDDVNANENKIRNQTNEIKTVQEQINDTLKTLSLKSNGDFLRKIENLEKIYESIESNDRFIKEQRDKKEQESDPLTPLDKKYATLDDLQDHYRLFINRIQQQLSTLGGGGETRFKYLDDINFNVSNPLEHDGRFLKYNASTDGFEFAEPATAFAIWVDGPFTLGQVGIGTTSITHSPYASDNLSLLVYGDTRITGIVSIGTSSITLDAGTGRIASGDVEVVNSDGGATYTGTVGVGTLIVGTGSSALTVSNTGITGPSLITIDPGGVGLNTGTVRIRGDLIIDGEETKINSQTLEVVDKNIGIASTNPKLNNIQLDGAGIIIHGSQGDKSLVWDNSNTRLGFNTNLYAPKYFGDGSSLTGILATSTIKNDGSSVGSATTINFSTNLSATVSAGVATVSANISLGDLANVDVSALGAGTTNFLLVYDPTVPGFKFINPTTLGINNDYNPDPLIDDFGGYE